MHFCEVGGYGLIIAYACFLRCTFLSEFSGGFFPFLACSFPPLAVLRGTLCSFSEPTLLLPYIDWDSFNSGVLRGD